MLVFKKESNQVVNIEPLVMVLLSVDIETEVLLRKNISVDVANEALRAHVID